MCTAQSEVLVFLRKPLDCSVFMAFDVALGFFGCVEGCLPAPCPLSCPPVCPAPRGTLAVWAHRAQRAQGRRQSPLRLLGHVVSLLRSHSSRSCQLRFASAATSAQCRGELSHLLFYGNVQSGWVCFAVEKGLGSYECTALKLTQDVQVPLHVTKLLLSCNTKVPDPPLQGHSTRPRCGSTPPRTRTLCRK